jgi:hypothetical protein
MNVDLSMCASSGKATHWNQTNWFKCERKVRKLQASIVKVARRDDRRETGSVSAGLCIGLSRMKGNFQVRF